VNRDRTSTTPSTGQTSTTPNTGQTSTTPNTGQTSTTPNTGQTSTPQKSRYIDCFALFRSVIQRCIIYTYYTKKIN
jgi:hypothetical protein